LDIQVELVMPVLFILLIEATKALCI